MDKDLKILMLEDLEEDIGLIERTLRKDGIPFISRYADTRDEYVKALQEFDPDVILSDHVLPQFNSVEALKICRSNSNVPFILVTGTVSEEFAVSCLKQGADDYVLKSNLVRLPSAIVSALRQRTVELKRKMAEQTLRRQNEELIKINRELDSFVYSVSHNLRAPLMSVLGLLKLAELEVDKLEVRPAKSTLNSFFDMMEQSIHKLDETLKEILDYSRNARSEVRIEKVNIKALIEESFERLKYHEGSEKIQKIVEIEQPVSFFSDAYRLSVVMNNLISNAIKYRDPNKQQSFIKIRVDVNDHFAVIHFTDNGIGISKEWLGKIYDMFFRATERSEGAGLGLYIVKETIDKLGGTITAESTLGEGTEFEIRVPNGLPSPQNK
jgi:signal transduction histidine kinase